MFTWVSAPLSVSMAAEKIHFCPADSSGANSSPAPVMWSSRWRTSSVWMKPGCTALAVTPLPLAWARLDSSLENRTLASLLWPYAPLRNTIENVALTSRSEQDEKRR